MPNDEPHVDRRSIDNGPTPRSIATAREAQQREREEVFRSTGIPVTSDGRLLRAPTDRCARPPQLRH
jgi:hypothetical protein